MSKDRDQDIAVKTPDAPQFPEVTSAPAKTTILRPKPHEKRKGNGQEWTSPYNPFNSVKALYWGSFIEDFYAGKRPAPITADVEPTNACNINCKWCYPMQTGFREEYKAHMNPERLLALPGFLKDWGVKSAQITGGGEPLFHPDIEDFFIEMRRVSMPLGLITNGVLLRTHLIDVLHDYADWIGFSMDAGTAKVWSELKGSPERNFDRIIENMEELNRRKKGVRVAYKYLINPSNFRDVVPAAQIAKETGCDDFHLRPTYNFGVFGEVDFDEVNDILDEVKSLEGDGFNVFTIKHKFGSKLTGQELSFPKCMATPLLLTFSADHNTYFCLDHRGEEDFALSSFDTDLEDVRSHWGSQEHLDRIARIVPGKCMKCTFKGYNDLYNSLDDLMVSYL